jgi:hypothetical protein
MGHVRTRAPPKAVREAAPQPTPRVTQLTATAAPQTAIAPRLRLAELPLADPKAESRPPGGGAGLPDQLRRGVEALSGLSLASVNVHRNSPGPARLGALAYTQGTDIHLGPGQERHLPHEAWHVVQQAQGRVRPTLQMRGAPPINDDEGLEREADVMGERALAAPAGPAIAPPPASPLPSASTTSPIQRLINIRAPTRWYRRRGGSASSRLNITIEAFNKKVLDGKPRQELEAALDDIIDDLGKISQGSVAKRTFSAALTQAVNKERRKIEAVREVMELASARAKLQERHELLTPEEGEESDVDIDEHMKSLEVLHATNPLKALGGGRSVGDTLASTNELQNVHQTGHSLIGGNKDSTKRRVAEVGLFYPEDRRRGSFSRRAADNTSTTKGIDPATAPPDEVLPKYAAVNLAQSEFGAFVDSSGAEGSIPLHFAIKPTVLEERATYTSSDSLRQWVPHESDNRRLQGLGMVSKTSEELPEDDKPWGTGPIATHGGGNFAKLVAASGQKLESDKNPQSYIETQIHGELRIDRDVDSVRANFAVLFGNPRFKSLYATLQSGNKPIKWYYLVDNVKEGNKVTQAVMGAKGDRFDRAWKEAEALWIQSNSERANALKARGDLGAAVLKNDLESGYLGDTQRKALKKIWDGLAGVQV